MKKIHILAVVGLLLRIFVALVSNNIHHPDEIFQYLEQAHREVFGYGYIPWEYRFGTRSWLLPGFISFFLYGFKYLKINDPVLYISFIKVVFSCISISLIYSVYFTTKQIASENAAKLAAIFSCFWYELIYFAHKPNPEVIATYLFMAALAIAVSKPYKYLPFAFGFLCALTIMLRLQYIIPISFLIFYVLFFWKRKSILHSALIFFIIIIIAGYIDYLTWDQFFVSYYNNYVFNKIYNVASLFGTMSIIYYFGALTISSLGIFCFAGLLSFIYWRNTWLILLCIASIILSHSIIPHKEYRFIFIVIPLFFILLSAIVSNYTFHCRQISKNRFLSIIFSVFLIISLLGLFNKLPSQKFIYAKSMVQSDDILDAYLYLFDDTDLHAILNIAKSWNRTGGYYYLHRDIPIYAKTHFKLDDNKNYLSYISHIICSTDYKNISGFETIKKIQSIEIRKQINPPSKYENLNIDLRNLMQKGIDDKYKSKSN
ncbi:hypothetical protein ACFL3L_02890 [Candidatus Neomarinimicrobiota bacterium]